jgi:hypothetical protein
VGGDCYILLKIFTYLEFPMFIKRGSLVAAMVLAAFFVAPLLTTRAHHAVLRFNIEEMVATADRIFIGKCVDVRETEEMIAQGMMPVTYYTFVVSETIKGKVPQTLTFKQLGHLNRKQINKNTEPAAGGIVNVSSKIHGMPNYNIGDEMMLMLIPQYMNGELTYPVGLYQGAFYVTRSVNGKALIKNSINNRGLFTNPYNNFKKAANQARIVFPDADRPVVAAKLSQQSTETLISKPGALPLEDFVGLVRSIVDSER